MTLMKPKVKGPGRKPINSLAIDKIAKAGVKEILITRKEWRLVVPPGAHILREKLGCEYHVSSLEDNTGWIIKKI